MKKYLILLSICFVISNFALCQSVGIGTTVPNGSAQLDITSSSKGILLPRMSTAAIIGISNPAKGLMVFDSSKNQLMVNMGTAAIPNWQTIVSKSGWNLTGNTGTNPATNFIGTTDASPLIIKVNNVKAGFLDSATNNVAFGYKTLGNNTSGIQNTAIGSNTMQNNFTGSFNTVSGMQSLQQHLTGDSNTAYGAFTLNRNTDAKGNTAIGTSSLYWNRANYNTGVGLESLFQNTVGDGNTGVGSFALGNMIYGYYNTAVGFEALYSDSTFSSAHPYATANTAVGYQSLYSNAGNYGGNTAVGYQSLLSNITGNSNTAIGYQSLLNNVDGIYNTAIGYQSLVSNTSGFYNTALGIAALYSNTSGRYNTAVGQGALENVHDAYYNTAIGYSAGGSILGYNNTIIGANSGTNVDGLYNCIAIGQAVVCTANSQAIIGNSATNTIGGYANWSNFSDGRYKKNIKENVKGIDFIMKLRPVTYQLDVQGISNKLDEGRGKEINESMKQSIAEKEKMIFSGFVAQEVEAAAKESGYDFSGVDAPKNENDFYGLRYGDFVVPLVKTVQEQQVIIDKQKQDITDLQKRLQSLEEQVKLLLQASTHKK